MYKWALFFPVSDWLTYTLYSIATVSLFFLLVCVCQGAGECVFCSLCTTISIAKVYTNVKQMGVVVGIAWWL